MISSQDRLEEGFFGDIIATVKVSSALKKYVEKLKKENNITDLSDTKKIEEFKKHVLGGVDIIEKSNLSADMKYSMRSGYLGGVSKQITKLTGKKPIEWNKTLKFDQKLLKYILNPDN